MPINKISQLKNHVILTLKLLIKLELNSLQVFLKVSHRMTDIQQVVS